MFKKVVTLLLFSLLLILLIQISPESKEESYILFSENFDDLEEGAGWFNAKLLVEHTPGLNDGNNVVRHAYEPSATGTPYIGHRFKLSQAVDEATLSFKMKLGQSFEFVRGGKMHGLAGGTATTGCKAIDPNGWSVRMMWRDEGQPVLYVYHQNRKHRCGDDITGRAGFRFQLNQWYEIAIYVKLNSASKESDGIASLYIDGVKHAEETNLKLTGNLRKNIDSFLYNSFYGGSDPSWSPSQTTYVYYDDFKVTRGFSLTTD